MTLETLAFALLLLAVGFALGRWSKRGPAVPPDPHVGARAAAQLSVEDKLAVTSAIKAGRKIEAVKIARERTRLGLREAKAVVDHLEANDPASGIG